MIRSVVPIRPVWFCDPRMTFWGGFRNDTIRDGPTTVILTKITEIANEVQ